MWFKCAALSGEIDPKRKSREPNNNPLLDPDFGRQSPPMRAPFSATDLLITSTTGTSISIATANTQKQSKYARADACCWRRFSRACQASCFDRTGSPVCCRNNVWVCFEEGLGG